MQSFSVLLGFYILVPLSKSGKKVSVKIIKVGKRLFLQAKSSLKMFIWLLEGIKGIMGMPKRFVVF